ncbi:hypothetical protein D3C86_2211630 [compost metagenome]
MLLAVAILEILMLMLLQETTEKELSNLFILAVTHQELHQKLMTIRSQPELEQKLLVDGNWI